MSAKQVLFHDAARIRIIEGVNVLADAVKVKATLKNLSSFVDTLFEGKHFSVFFCTFNLKLE